MPLPLPSAAPLAPQQDQDHDATSPFDPVGDAASGFQAEATAGTLRLSTELLGDLLIPDGAARAQELEALGARAAQYATRARGPGTRRVYRSAWTGYVAWCAAHDAEPLSGDPARVALYVTHRAANGVAVSTIRVDLAAIRTAHLFAGLTLDNRDPRLAMVMDGIARSHGTRPRRQVAPAVPEVLHRLLATCAVADTPLGARDRAMLLLGFGAALRRSELVALHLGDVTVVPNRGLRLLIRRSKTDQHGAGHDIAIWAQPAAPEDCPLVALQRWQHHRDSAADLTTLDACVRSDRPLFCGMTKSGRLTGTWLSDKAVARLMKAAAERAGLDPTRFSGHSLRAGLATAAGDAGASLPDLMRQTRHKSTQVALAYLRPADLWRNNVTQRVFAGQPEEG